MPVRVSLSRACSTRGRSEPRQIWLGSSQAGSIFIRNVQFFSKNSLILPHFIAAMTDLSDFLDILALFSFVNSHLNYVFKHFCSLRFRFLIYSTYYYVEPARSRLTRAGPSKKSLVRPCPGLGKEIFDIRPRGWA